MQATIQGEQVRVTGKSRDDLQTAIAMFRQSDIELPLQFTNFQQLAHRQNTEQTLLRIDDIGWSNFCAGWNNAILGQFRAFGR